jgi:putative ATPase
MPEAQIILSQAASYVATAPKSNAAVNAIYDAMGAVRDVTIQTIPPHLQDAHYPGSAKLGRGDGYLYAHDFPNHYVKQQYLPDELVGRVFYQPSENGYEKQIQAWMKKIREEA